MATIVGFPFLEKSNLKEQTTAHKHTYAVISGKQRRKWAHKVFNIKNPFPTECVHVFVSLDYIFLQKMQNM